MAKPILVTGATGFVGRAVTDALAAANYPVRKAVRESLGEQPPADEVVVGDIGDLPEWSAALNGVDTVIHLAARVHVMNETHADPLSEFRRVNVEATRHLAQSAAQQGVRRLIYLSSIKVNGEGTTDPYTERSPANPQDPYGVSKWEAEQALRTIEQSSGLEVVVIRPPLVYGADVKGNFLKLVQLVSRGLPLPFGAVNNRRTLIGVANLADLIVTCVDHPAAAGELFLAADNETVSTKVLVEEIARAQHRSVLLLPIPPALMELAGKLSHREEVINRLFGLLEVDGTKARQTLSWSAPLSLRAGIEQVIQWYERRNSSGA